MTYEFAAVDCEADPSGRFIGFADDSHYVWMQPDETVPPSASGDHLWLEIHDQQFGGRGGIEKVHVSRQRFVISLTAARAAQTAGYDTISVRFSITDADYDRLMTVLRVAMRGSEQLVEVFE